MDGPTRESKKFSSPVNASPRGGAVPPAYRQQSATACARAIVTLAAWLIFILSAMGIVTALAMVPLEHKFFGSIGSFHSLLQRAPRVHDFAAAHWAGLSWAGLCTFSLSALGSGGMIHRRLWGLRMTQGLTLTWMGVFLFQAVVWMAWCLGARRTEFAMGTLGGLGCLLSCAALAGAHFFWRSRQVRLQFGVRPAFGREVFVPTVVTLSAADLRKLATKTHHAL